MIASAWKASLSISLFVVSAALFKDADLSPFGWAVAGLQMLAAVTLWVCAFTEQGTQPEQESSASENTARGYRARQQKAKAKGGAA